MHPARFLSSALLAVVFLFPVPSPALDPEGLSCVVAYNADSRDSRELARLYAKAHDVPFDNLCAVKAPARGWHMSEAEFGRMRDEVDAFLIARKLDGRVRFLVLSCDIPTRVGADNSVTAALFYGLHPRTPGSKGCDMAPCSVNPYFSSERTYRPEAGWVEGNRPLVFALAVPSRAEGKALLARSVLPAPEKSVVCLHGSGDGARNVRHGRYAAVERLWKLCATALFPSVSLSVATTNFPRVHEPVAGYTIGRATLPYTLTNETLSPVAIAEHLTSCGAIFPDACGGQDTLWKWFAAGASASYGTVAEPCNFTAKFPDPAMHFWYARGFTAGEAMWMAVKNPYQGLMAGDPLMRPFAKGPDIEVLRPKPGEVFRPGDSFRLRLRRAPGEAAPVHVAMYVDGRFHAVVAQPIAPLLNELVATIGEDEFRYAVAPGEMAGEAVAGLAWSIQRHSRGKYRARAFSDRLEVTAVAAPAGGEEIPFAVSVEQGRGEGLYMEARALSDTLVETSPGTFEACALFSLGSVGEFELSYPADLSGLERGKHVASFVVRDGSALEAAGRTDCVIRIP